MQIEIKPLSVNQCWQGKRFKTPKYKDFEKQVLLLLPNNYKVPLGDLQITLKWGFSSKLSDWDNPIKPFQDILQKKYNFNDSRIFKATVEKEIVKKGEEYIEFNIKKM
jgi:Holliday junction resolvase RusA-like endonuclease